MKNTLFILIAIVCASCHSFREKTRLKNGSNSLVEENISTYYGFRFAEKDSQNRVWHFSTDSMLSFHPDYGLFSVGGHLYISENRVGLQQMQIDIDSLEENRNTATTYTREDESRARYRSPWWIAGLVLLGVAVSYLTIRLLAGKWKNRGLFFVTRDP